MRISWSCSLIIVVSLHIHFEICIVLLLFFLDAPLILSLGPSWILEGELFKSLLLSYLFAFRKVYIIQYGIHRRHRGSARRGWSSSCYGQAAYMPRDRPPCRCLRNQGPGFMGRNHWGEEVPWLHGRCVCVRVRCLISACVYEGVLEVDCRWSCRICIYCIF